MKLKFKQQQYQAKAVEAVAEGQSRKQFARGQC